MDITIQKSTQSSIWKLPQEEMKLGFGRFFTDHMFLLEFSPDAGWYKPRIVPYGPLQMDPASMCFHYGQEIFEGLKAYLGKNGRILLFRHKDNLARMNRSAKRLCMPEFDIEAVSDAMKTLILLDRSWIPKTRGCALYIRPTMISADAALGVRPSLSYLFFIILSPVAAYYPEGFNPVKIFVSDQHVRAVKGGIGEAKAAANYAASLYAQMEARKQGYSQVLWLDGKEMKYIEEVGTMNIFFVFDDEIVTAPLGGSILPGITRDSVIHLLKDWGTEVHQRPISIDEVIQGAKSGRLKEVFGSGTAAIISPVSHICYKGDVVSIADCKAGRVSMKLYESMLRIQYGEGEDVHQWVESIG